MTLDAFPTMTLAPVPGVTAPFPSVDELPRISLDGLASPSTAASGESVREAFEQARAKGYADGYAEGLQSAWADVRNETATAVAALQRAADELAARDVTSIDDLTTTAIELAISISETILQHETSASDLGGRRALVRALTVAPNRGSIDAHLHPLDVDTIENVADAAPGRDVRLVPDETVERGGCILHVGSAQIDAQLGTALERVRAELMGTGCEA